jgi:hypothetical protein
MLELSGPDNEAVNERLIEWAHRANSFAIFGTQGTPLAQIGIGNHADDEVVDWLEAFSDKVRRELGITIDRVRAMLAQANGLTVKELEDLYEDPPAELRGVDVAVCD